MLRLTSAPSALRRSLSCLRVQVFGRTASWEQESGQLVLSVAPGSNLTEYANASTGLLTVSDGTALPSSGGAFLRIGDELLRVVSASGEVFTVERAQGGTAAANHSAGSAVRAALAPGRALGFSFQLVNPDASQDSPGPVTDLVCMLPTNPAMVVAPDPGLDGT